VRLRRASSTRGLEFDLEIPDGFEVHRDVAGNDLVISAGEPDDPDSIVIGIGAVRDGGFVTLDEHVRRVRERSSDVAPHLVDEGPAPLSGHESWWTCDAVVLGGRSLMLERWMLVRDGVGWTVSVRIPALNVHQLRDGALAVVSTLHFK
jgi:hypothetical protein